MFPIGKPRSFSVQLTHPVTLAIQSPYDGSSVLSFPTPGFTNSVSMIPLPSIMMLAPQCNVHVTCCDQHASELLLGRMYETALCKNGPHELILHLEASPLSEVPVLSPSTTLDRIAHVYTEVSPTPLTFIIGKATTPCCLFHANQVKLEFAIHPRCILTPGPSTPAKHQEHHALNPLSPTIPVPPVKPLYQQTITSGPLFSSPLPASSRSQSLVSHESGVPLDINELLSIENKKAHQLHPDIATRYASFTEPRPPSLPPKVPTHKPSDTQTPTFKLAPSRANTTSSSWSDDPDLPPIPTKLPPPFLGTPQKPSSPVKNQPSKPRPASALTYSQTLRNPSLPIPPTPSPKPTANSAKLPSPKKTAPPPQPSSSKVTNPSYLAARKIPQQESYRILALALVIIRFLKAHDSDHAMIHKWIRDHLFTVSSDHDMFYKLDDVSADFSLLSKHIKEFHSLQFSHDTPASPKTPCECPVKRCPLYPRPSPTANLTLTQNGFSPDAAIQEIESRLTEITCPSSSRPTVTLSHEFSALDQNSLNLAHFQISPTSSAPSHTIKPHKT